MNDKTLKRISKLIKKEPKTVQQLIAKLFEEGGELAAEILKRDGVKGSSGKTAKQIDANILEEATDVMMIAMAIVGKKGYTLNDMFDVMERKLDKWRNVMKSIPEWKRNMKVKKKR